MRELKYGEKVKERKYRGRYMPIATLIGYVRAKKEYGEEIAKALGYAFAIMPNIIRNGSRIGMGRDNGVWVSKPKQSADNDDLLIEQNRKAKYVHIGSWDLGIDKKAVFSPRMKPVNGKMIKWTAEDFNKQMMKLTPQQKKKAISFIEKEFKKLKLTAKMFDRKCWGNGWATFVQVLMERVGDYIYQTI